MSSRSTSVIPLHERYRSRIVLETVALPEAVLREHFVPKEFDADACKRDYATARDPKKGPAFIEAKRAAHEQAEVARWEEFKANAHKSPLTGRVAALGVGRTQGEPEVFLAREERDEPAVIRAFLSEVRSAEGAGGLVEVFDPEDEMLAFLYRRGLKHRMDVGFMRSGRYWSDAFRDLSDEWTLGSRDREVSLRDFALFMGVKEPLLELPESFGELLEEDPSVAEESLLNRLVVTSQLADRLDAPGIEVEAVAAKPDLDDTRDAQIPPLPQPRGIEAGGPSR